MDGFSVCVLISIVADDTDVVYVTPFVLPISVHYVTPSLVHIIVNANNGLTDRLFAFSIPHAVTF